MYFGRHAPLREDVEVQPRHTILHSYVAGQQVGISLDLLSCLFCGHPLDSEVASFAQNVRRQIDRRLTTHQATSIAPKTSLIGFGLVIVAIHRSFENVATNNEQHVQIVCVEELPRLVVPSGQGVVADEFFGFEELLQLSNDLRPGHYVQS